MKHELRLWLKATPIRMPLNIKKVNLKNNKKGKDFFGKMQELNICVCLPRWTRFHFGKSIGQGHSL